jgi:hypothetical protein
MPITVTSPSGHEVTFPDGTSHEDIAAAFDQLNGKPLGKPVTDPDLIAQLEKAGAKDQHH